MQSKKHFTLVEIVLTIVVLSILLSIVLIKVTDFKSKAVVSSISSNISVLQTATDAYFLEKEAYPIADKSALGLSNPQLIDTKLLAKEGYLKKDLDTSKVKNQYYWVDVFGRVWGATDKEVGSINIVKKSNGSKSLEFLVDDKFSGFDIYEVTGYSSVSDKSELRNLYADVNGKGEKSYKVIDSVEYNGSKRELVNFELLNQQANYLISMKDEYGLELPPMGKFNGSKSPSYRGDGIYTFEIEGEEDMYWLDFLTMEEKKGASTVNYRFKVKDNKGEFLPWTEDFFSLPESKHIVVEIEIKSDNNGNTATVYDVQVLFNYKDEVIITPEPVPCGVECYTSNVTCPKIPVNGTFTPSTSGTLIHPFYIQGKKSIQNTYILEPQISAASHEIMSVKYYIEENGQYVLINDLEQLFQEKCGYALYDIKVNIVPPEKTGTKIICGTGGTHSQFYGENKRIVYSYYIEEDQKVQQINIAPTKNLISVSYEMSVNGQPFEAIDSIADIETPSCLNVVYEFTETIINVNPPVLKGCVGDCPKIELCEENCKSTGPACIFDCSKKEGGGEGCKGENCNPKPEPEKLCATVASECDNPPCEENCTPIVNDPEWETVETIRFFGNGPLNRTTRWLDVETKDAVTNKDTQIVYNYSKRIGNGNWSGLYEDFKTTGTANAVMAVAFIQVRKKELNNVPLSEYPMVESILFKTEAGDLPASMTNPSLVIIPKKDNNAGRDIFSTESKITWDVEVADPRNLKITNIEWSGDVREQYPKGTYEVRARATNERGYNSGWISYRLEVLEEKPVAQFTVEDDKKYFPIGTKLSFNTSLSVDPDGDNIINYEWQNKKDVYDKSDAGEITISLRVQDGEGYWSDLVSKTYTLYDPDENLWFVDGEPAIPAGYFNSFDKNTSSIDYFPKDVNRAEITWHGDLSGKSLHVQLSGNIEFLDKNGVRLNHLRNNDSFVGLTTDNHINMKVIVPDGATKLVIHRYIGYNTISINSIYLIEPENELPELTNFVIEESTFSATITFNKPSSIGRVYFINKSTNKLESTTTNSITIKSLQSNSLQELMVVGVDNTTNFNGTNPIFLDFKTKEPLVNFSSPSLSVEAFDDDEGNYANYTTATAEVTWDKDLTGEVLVVRASTTAVSFYDKNKNPIKFFNDTTSYGLETSDNFTYARMVVPEGAVGMKLRSKYGSGSTVSHIAVQNYKQRISNVSDFNTTVTSYGLTGLFKKPSDVSRVIVLNETDGTFKNVTNATNFEFTTLTPNTDYRFKVMSFDSKFNVSEPIYFTVKTKPIEVNFYGVSNDALDDDNFTKHDFGSKEGYVTWDKDISNQTLLIHAYGSNITFYDKNDNLLKKVDDYSGYGTTVSYNRINAKVIVPKGAVKMKFSSYDYNNATVSVLRFVNYNSNPDLVSDIKMTSTSNLVSATWNRKTAYSKMYMTILETGKSTNSNYGDASIAYLEPDTEYTVQFVAVDKNFNAQIFTQTIRTKP